LARVLPVGAARVLANSAVGTVELNPGFFLLEAIRQGEAVRRGQSPAKRMKG